MKQLYKHITTGTIIEAEKYRPGLEDGFIKCFYKSKKNKIKKIPYIIIMIGKKLEKIIISENDYIIFYSVEDKKIKGLYSTEKFYERFERI